APRDLVAVVDADNAVTEFSETNNRATIFLATNTPPDARIAASVLSGPVPLLVNFDASASFDANGDAMTYGWSFGDGSASAAGAAVGHTFNVPGRYTVTLAVTDARGAVGTAAVVINAGACGSPPAPPSAGNNGPVCAGGTLNLTASGPGGAAYFWTGPNGFTSTAQNPQIAAATASASGAYSVLITVAGCASAPATTTAVVNPAPSAAIAAGTAVCANRKANFASVPSAGGGATYAWSITNGTITGGAGTSTVTFTAGGSALVHFAVTVTSGGGCGQQAGQIDVPIVSCAAEPEGLLVDPAQDQSNGNGILEPGETVFVRPSWKNLGGSPLPLTGTASGATGPPGAVYYFNDSSADYGSIGAGATTDCATATANCYEFTVSNPAARPATHWDAAFTETLSSGDPPMARLLHIGGSFTDVPTSHVFYPFVERILHTGVTTGCTATSYCPDLNVFRLQMAVFIARSQAGGDGNIPVSGSAQGNPYNCVFGGQSQFTDIAPDNPFCRHVHYLFSTGVTTGCVTTPPRQYCPNDNVSRGQMALFIARAVAGSDAAVPVTYGPDPITGRSYSCNAGTPNLHFTDVTTSDIYCRHTHYLWAKDVISGFPDGSFGPSLLVNRGAMAKFLANGFGETLIK
ncbi:MAG TPA: PKD domain-containing protein, partial [Thermoanaerobaculia bacterium]|nr:PKD domain-containing protein [Thermoanaerobaculia bacterium]